MRLEILEKISALMTAAFGLVAALAWNGAIRAIFEKLFGTADQIWAMLVYAVVVTLIAVFAIIWITRVTLKAKEKLEQAKAESNKEE